jgi:putative lipoprotein
MNDPRRRLWRTNMIRRPGRWLVTFVLAASVWGACIPVRAGTLEGTAAYRERIALPPDAVFEAVLEDVSRADAPAEALGRAKIDPAGQPPFRFEIAYDDAALKPGHRYAVGATVRHRGRLLFTTDRAYPINRDGGAPLTLLLVRAEAERRSSLRPGSEADLPAQLALTEPRLALTGMFTYMADAAAITLCADGGRLPVAMVDSPLRGTYWKLTRLRETPVQTAEQQREPHLIFANDELRISGSGGCNRVTGSFEIDGDELRLGRMAATRMACPSGMEQERHFLQSMKDVERYRISGSHLEMLDAQGAVVARFEAVALR